jgi:hypothetical protein
MPLIDLGPAEETMGLVDLGPAVQSQEYNPIQSEKDSVDVWDSSVKDGMPTGMVEYEQNLLKYRNTGGFEPNQIEGNKMPVRIEKPVPVITRENTPQNKANMVEMAFSKTPALARIAISSAVKLDPFNFRRFVIEKINPQMFSGITDKDGKEIIFDAQDIYSGIDQYQRRLSFASPEKYVGIAGNAAKVVSEFAVLPGKAATIPITAVKFGMQSAAQFPVGEEAKLSLGDFIVERAKATAISAGTGAAVGLAGKYIPNPFLRIPTVTGGFVTLTGVESNWDKDAMIESGITVLGFEAVGLAKAGKYKEAAKKAQEVNPELAKTDPVELQARIEDFSKMMTPGEKMPEKTMTTQQEELLGYGVKPVEIPGKQERTKPLSKPGMMEKFANLKEAPKDLQEEMANFIQQERYSELVERANAGDKRAVKELNDYVQGLKLPFYDDLLARVNNGDKEALKLIEDGNYYGGPNPKPELAVPKETITSEKNRPEPTSMPVKPSTRPTVEPKAVSPIETPATGTPLTETISDGISGMTPSRLAQRTEELAIEKKLVDNLGELAGYQKTPDFMKVQARLAREQMDLDYDKAKRMAFGEMPPDNPELKPASIYRAVEQRAGKEGDIETLRKLGLPSDTSIPSRLSGLGQEIKAADVEFSDSPSDQIRSVQTVREKAVQEKTKKDIVKEKKKGAKEIKDKIAKEVSATKWEKFIRSLEC